MYEHVEAPCHKLSQNTYLPSIHRH